LETVQGIAMLSRRGDFVASAIHPPPEGRGFPRTGGKIQPCARRMGCALWASRIDVAAKRTKRINSKALEQHRKRFLRFFPKAFRDQRYLDWEHAYKWESHKLWVDLLNEEEFQRLLRKREYLEIATRALRVEQKTVPPFLFSFEKMALRDALRTVDGACLFADGLFNLLHGPDDLRAR